MNNKQTCITNNERFLNQMCEYFATIGLCLSKKFITNQLSNFKIHTTVSLQSCRQTLPQYETARKPNTVCVLFRFGCISAV